VVRHWDWNRHVDADHAHLDTRDEVAGGVAVAGEDRYPVAVFVFGGQPQGFFVVLGAGDAQHRAEDFVGVDRHVCGDVIKQGGADEVPALQAGVTECQFVAGLFPAVDDDLGAGSDAGIDVVPHALEGGAGDQRPVVGLGVEAVADAQIIDPLD